MPALLPRPSALHLTGGELRVGPLRLEADDVASAAARRLQDAWPALRSASTRAEATPVRITADAVARRPLGPGVDESYALAITTEGVALHAATDVGARRGVETLIQWADEGALACVEIRDEPRVTWRGLLVDVCRHWIDLPHLLACVDAMAAAKLDVLHLHLSDDHAFRLESTTHPRLHEVASGGHWLSHHDVHRLVAHADAAGIRVVPELDVPGHVTSWLVAYPHLAATPGPFALARGPGIAKVALDPEREEVHEFLAELLTEVVDLFPDPYLHIGGDEVDPDAWPHLADPHAAQARFTERTAALVRSLGRIPIVWDEAWHPELAPDVVCQVWRGQGLARASAAEHRPTLFSSPYYLDLSFDPRHHRVDPLIGADGWTATRADLRADPTVGALGQLIAAVEDGYPTPPGTPDETDPTTLLGGEACLWTELCPQPLFHLRVWPAAGAVADTLWSGPPVPDPGPGETADGAAQLDRFAEVLAATTAVDVEADRRAHWLELAGGDTELAEAVAVLATCCEPIKWYSRHLVQTDPEQAPSLDRFVDALPPTATARRLPPDPTRWRAAADLLVARVDAPDRVAELRPVAERLLAVCDHLEDPATADPGIVPIGEILVTAGLPIAPARG